MILAQIEQSTRIDNVLLVWKVIKVLLHQRVCLQMQLQFVTTFIDIQIAIFTILQFGKKLIWFMQT